MIDPTGALLAADFSGDGTTAASAGISLYLVSTGGALTSETPVQAGITPLHVVFYNAP